MPEEVEGQRRRARGDVPGVDLAALNGELDGREGPDGATLHKELPDIREREALPGQVDADVLSGVDERAHVGAVGPAHHFDEVLAQGTSGFRRRAAALQDDMARGRRDKFDLARPAPVEHRPACPRALRDRVDRQVVKTDRLELLPRGVEECVLEVVSTPPMLGLVGPWAVCVALGVGGVGNGGV